MSAATDSRAERVKLARLLGLDGADALACVRGVPAGELRAYRYAVTDVLFDDGRATLERTAEASRLLPAPTLARIGARALGPLICARLTGLLDPGRASEIAGHFPVEFLAELAAELDPRRVVDVVVSTPPERVLAIALEMAARGEHVAMGRFVGYLDRETLAACLRELADADVLRVAFVLEDYGRLEEIVELAGLERTRRMLADAPSQGLGDEARGLLGHLGAPQRRRLRAGAGQL